MASEPPINHTARYMQTLETVGTIMDIPGLAAGLYNALHAEHDWVIRLDERLNMANQKIEQLQLQLAQAKAAISIVDPATGTSAFLANPPFGEKGGEG